MFLLKESAFWDISFTAISNRGYHGVWNCQQLQQFVQQPVTSKENTKAPQCWSFVRQSIGHRWIPVTKGQWCGKRFHVRRHHVARFLRQAVSPPISRYMGLSISADVIERKHRVNFLKYDWPYLSIFSAGEMRPVIRSHVAEKLIISCAVCRAGFDGQ